MGHTLQLYIVHRMKALPKIPPLAGLDNFFRCGAGALARESFWVAQRFQRCDSAYVTNHSISPLSFRTGFSREESAFPSWRIPPFLILADALLSLRQTDSLTPQPLQGRNSDSPARKCRVSKGSRLRAPARHYTRHRTAPANQSSRAAGQSTSRTVLRMFVSGRTSRPPKPRAARQHLPAQEAVTSRECVDLKGLDWKGTPSVASLQSPSLLSFRAQRGICFSPHLLRQPQLRNQNHPSPLQGRNDDSPARKCRVSHGLRSCAPHAPLPRRVRPAR